MTQVGVYYRGLRFTPAGRRFGRQVVVSLRRINRVADNTAHIRAAGPVAVRCDRFSHGQRLLDIDTMRDKHGS